MKHHQYSFTMNAGFIIFFLIGVYVLKAFGLSTRAAVATSFFSNLLLFSLLSRGKAKNSDDKENSSKKADLKDKQKSKKELIEEMLKYMDESERKYIKEIEDSLEIEEIEEITESLKMDKMLREKYGVVSDKEESVDKYESELLDKVFQTKKIKKETKQRKHLLKVQEDHLPGYQVKKQQRNAYASKLKDKKRLKEAFIASEILNRKYF
jgi:protoporphyrinogen oxidase